MPKKQRLNVKKIGLKRIRVQEEGNVLRWFEGNGVIASLVKGDIQNEAEWRVSDEKGRFSSFTWRGNRDLMLRKSDGEIKRQILKMIKREMQR